MRKGMATPQELQQSVQRTQDCRFPLPDGCCIWPGRYTIIHPLPPYSHLLRSRLKGINGKLSQVMVPDVIFILFYLAYDVFHDLKHCWFFFVVDISLKQFQNIDTIALILYKGGEKHIEPIVDRDKFIPVFCATA